MTVSGSLARHATGEVASSQRPHASPGVGLANARTAQVLLTLVVVAVFFQKIEIQRYESGTFPVPDLLFTVAIGLTLVKVLADGSVGLARPKPMMSWDFALIGLLIVLISTSCLAVLLSPRLTDGSQIVKSGTHLVFLLAAALVLGRILTRELVRFVLLAFFAAAAASSALAIIQAIDLNVVTLGVTKALSLVERQSPGGFVRPVSIFSEPAYLGYAALAGIVIGVGLFDRSRAKLWVAGIALCVFGLILSAAAGPIVAAGVFAGYFVLTARFLRRTPVVVVLVVVLTVGAVVLTPAGGVIRSRATNIVAGTDASAEVRSQLGHASIKVWEKAPFTGVGLGDSRLYFPQYVYVPFQPDAVFDFPSSNVYLALLGETGPIGVLALILVFAILLWPDRRRRGDPLDGVTRILLGIVALQFLFIGGFLAPPLWFWAGLRLGLQQPPVAETSPAAP